MNSWIKLLLATTCMTAVSLVSAQAGVVSASTASGGSFGSSTATATVLDRTITQAIGDVEKYFQGYASTTAVRDYFSLQGASLTGFHLTFVTSAIGISSSSGSSSASSGPSYYGIDTAASLQQYVGVATLTSFSGSGLQALAPTLTYAGSTGGGSGMSDSGAPSGPTGSGYIPTPDLDPILTLYDADWNPLDTIELISGNNVGIDVTGVSLSMLNFSVSTPFVYTVDITSTVSEASVPEPTALATLGLGVAAVAARRRRKR